MPRRSKSTQAQARFVEGAWSLVISVIGWSMFLFCGFGVRSGANLTTGRKRDVSHPRPEPTLFRFVSDSTVGDGADHRGNGQIGQKSASEPEASRPNASCNSARARSSPDGWTRAARVAIVHSGLRAEARMTIKQFLLHYYTWWHGATLVLFSTLGERASLSDTISLATPRKPPIA